MTLVLNGEPRPFEDGIMLAALLQRLGITVDGIAVAVNDAVIRRAAFESHQLADGDRVEIIKAAAGG